MLDHQLLTNHKINYQPCVLSNTLFKVVDYKTDIVGFWLDEQGNIHEDNIEAKNYFAIETGYLNISIKNMFASGEKAVFYKNVYNEGVIAYPDGSHDILKNRIAILEYGYPNDNYIGFLLEKHGGLTIYKIDNGNYLIEIYK